MLFDKCAELLPRWAFDLQTDLVELILNIWTLQYNINLTLEPLNDRIGRLLDRRTQTTKIERLGTDGPIFHCAGFAFELRGGALRAHRDRRRALAIEDCGQLDCCFAVTRLYRHRQSMSPPAAPPLLSVTRSRVFCELRGEVNARL
jgi:hypothetical protein